MDITKHKLSDPEASIEDDATKSRITLRLDNYGIDLNKSDGIAIAKHFAQSMTAEDINEIIFEYNKPEQKVSENWVDFLAEIIPKIHDTERQPKITYNTGDDLEEHF